jgi:hypothetical protein
MMYFCFNFGFFIVSIVFDLKFMHRFKQVQLNAYLAIGLGLSLIIGESIRRWGAWGHWSRWMDDYFMGLFLIIPALLMIRGNRHGNILIIGGWGFTAGLLYGSFFSKLTNTAYHFESNIEPSLLINLIGLAFFTSVAGLLWSLWNEMSRPFASIK